MDSSRTAVADDVYLLVAVELWRPALLADKQQTPRDDVISHIDVM
jgi:hypothetical protein